MVDVRRFPLDQLSVAQFDIWPNAYVLPPTKDLSDDTITIEQQVDLKFDPNVELSVKLIVCKKCCDVKNKKTHPIDKLWDEL